MVSIMPTRYPVILRHDDGRPAVLSSTLNPERAGLSVPCHCGGLDIVDAFMARVGRELGAALDAKLAELDA